MKSRTPAAIKAYLKRVCDAIEWVKYKNHYIVSDPARSRATILDETGEQIYDVDTESDGKRWIDDNRVGR